MEAIVIPRKITIMLQAEAPPLWGSCRGNGAVGQVTDMRLQSKNSNGEEKHKHKQHK